MLTKLRLTNFRGFENHELPLAPLTLIVGRNNAGKSTVIDALRFVALATARYKTLRYIEPRSEYDLPEDSVGIAPSLRDQGFEGLNLFFRYRDPPAVITAEFAGAGSLTIYLFDDDEIFIIVRDERNQIVRSPVQARRLNLSRVNILPQLIPVADSEERLDETYVRRSLSTSRSSIHFRNELFVLNQHFPTFQNLCEENWPRLQIQRLVTDAGEHGSRLELFVRDEDFVGDVRWMGHGLQIWLQTMWFLARVDQREIIVLDEPDVFLHADLQRKLIRILKNQNRQSVIATHSIEMMAEVDPSCIVIADRRRRRSQFATSLPAVQGIIEQMGGVHNIHLARLWSHRKVIFVEGGDDLVILKIFQDKAYPTGDEPFDILPHFDVGGWGGWNLVVGSSMMFRGSGGERIRKYCIMDRDYHSEEEIDERKRSAAEHGIDLHIWSKKEIENYTVSPEVISRYISNRIRKGQTTSLEEVRERLDEICESLRDETLDLISQQFNYAHRPRNPSEGNRYAREVLRGRWTSLAGKLGVVGGKTLLARISEWTQRSFGIGLNAFVLARFMRKEELDAELVSILGSLCKSHWPVAVI
jgi:predicted ATP-dependent endonuclease of OLD family